MNCLFCILNRLCSAILFLLRWGALPCLSYYTKSFCFSFSENNCLSFFHELRSVHELEMNSSFISRTQHLLLCFYANYSCSLSDDTTMNYSLIIGLYSCGVVEDCYLSLKFPHRIWIFTLINDHHSFTKVFSFQLNFLVFWFDMETNALSCNSFIYSNSLMMYTFDLNLIKFSLFVWSK